MASETTVSKRDHVEIALDACLMTAGLFAIVASIALGIVALAGGPSVPTWLQVIGQLFGSVLILGVGVGGPVLTWRLYERRFSPVAILGAILGAGAVGLLTASAAFLSVPLAWIVSPISKSEFAGPITLLGIMVIAFAGAMVWLLFDAARDAAPARRSHARLDVVRLTAAVAIVVFSAVVGLISVMRPGLGSGEAIIFALVFGISAGAMTAGADLLSTYVDRDKGQAQGVAPTA